MTKDRKLYASCSAKQSIALGTMLLLIGLLALDIIYQGQVYQRLPGNWQKKLTKCIDR